MCEDEKTYHCSQKEFFDYASKCNSVKILFKECIDENIIKGLTKAIKFAGVTDFTMDIFFEEQ